jgi:hypothetical protein
MPAITQPQYNIFTLLVIISLTSFLCTVHNSQIVSITIHQLIQYIYIYIYIYIYYIRHVYNTYHG